MLIPVLSILLCTHHHMLIPALPMLSILLCTHRHVDTWPVFTVEYTLSLFLPNMPRALTEHLSQQMPLTPYVMPELRHEIF